MEENSADSKMENFQVPPLKDMKDIISELIEKSDTGDEPLVFNNFNEDKIDLLSGIDKDVSDSKFQLEGNESKNNDEKSELGLLLEKDLSDIDFEISLDMFDDIKIKEEDLTGFVEKVSSQLANGGQNNDINFKLPFFKENLAENSVSSLNLEIKQATEDTITENVVNDNRLRQMTVIFEESMEISLSPEAEKIVEVKDEKSEIHSNSNNEIERIMTELQAASLIHKNDQHSNGYLECTDKESISNASLNFLESAGSIGTDKEKMFFNAEHNKPSSIAIGENTDIIQDTKVDLKPHDENLASATQSAKNINCNDSIQAVIESVIQASLQQDYGDTDSNEIDLSDQEEITEKKRKLDFSTENCILKKKSPYGIFEVVVPLIGKNVMKPGNDVPFTQRYDLARQRNELRAKFQKNDPDFPIPTMSFEEWRKKRESRTKEEIAAEERKKVIKAIQLAKSFTKIAIRILMEYEKDEPNEAAMIKFFRYFEFAPASPLSLLYAPHFVHTMMLCRGDEDLCPNLRRAANECYDKCHALFPIPEGYNFETVYTSEVKKYVPDELDQLSDHVLDYGDYDSSDLEDNASDCSDDSDKDWE